MLLRTQVVLCVWFQAVDAIEDIDTFQATLSPVDGLCLPELSSTSVAELLLNELPATESSYSPLSESSPQHALFAASKHDAMRPLPAMADDILMSSYSSSVDLPMLADDAEGLDELQSLLHVPRLSSDVMLTDTDRHSLLLPGSAAATDLDASFDSVQLELASVQQQPMQQLAALDADNADADFLLDDTDWSSVQVIRTLCK